MFAMTAFFVISCNREDFNDEISGMDSYFPLCEGNYWIYDHYRIQQDGTETLLLNNRDSIVITHDTIINSKKYYVYEGTDSKLGRREMQVLKIMRDSSGYLVNHKGEIHFSTVNFDQDLLVVDYVLPDRDTVYITRYRMENQPVIVNTPAGRFEALNFRGTLNDRYHTVSRYLNNYHTRGVGEVLDDYFYLSDSTIYYERRLVRYHVNPVNAPA
jgi:hypothetical protein